MVNANKAFDSLKDIEIIPVTEKYYASWPDMLGVDFHPGDIVCVGVTVGQSASLTVGVVQGILKYDSKGNPLMRGNGSTQHTDVNGSVRWVANPLVPTCKVRVIPLVDSANRWSRSGTLKSSIYGPEKILKTDYTPEDIADIMEVYDD